MADSSDHRVRNFIREAFVGAYLHNLGSIEKKAMEGLDSIYARYVGKDGDFAPAEVIAYAAKQKDTLFLERMNPACDGIKNLKKTPGYLFLQAVANDDVGFVNYSRSYMRDINRLAYWDAENQAAQRRVYFLTPAHLVKSFQMASALHDMGARFDLPDAEGRLPLLFIARRAVNRDVFPLLMREFHVNAHFSGRGHDELSCMDGPLFDPPLFQAIRHANTHAIKGLEQGAPDKIDLNMFHNRLTPLMYAVIMADNAVEGWQQHPGLATRLNMVRHLWILKTLASSPHVDPGLSDHEGWRAESHACAKPVREALQEGLRLRQVTAPHSGLEPA